MRLKLKWNTCTCRKTEPGAVEKYSSTIGPTQKYTIITFAVVSYLRSSVVRALHRHRKGKGSIPAGGPIVNGFFSTVPGWFFDMCVIYTRA